MAAQATSALDSRPPVEAIDDCFWYVNEAPSEMGEGSPMGAMLERASQERALVVVDDSYMHRKKPAGEHFGGEYGKSLSAMPWQEWVAEPTANDPDAGYMRRIWGEKAKQTPVAVQVECGQKQIIATEMYRNVGAVLWLMPARLRTLLLTQHTPRRHPMVLRHVFGANVRIAHLADAAREAFRVADDREAQEMTVGAWLEGLALRFKEGKGRAGEKGVIEGTRKDSARELAAAYVAFEDARARLPYGRRYPHQSAARRARRLSTAGP